MVINTISPTNSNNFCQRCNKNNFYLISGEGYPSLLHHLKNAVEEVNEIGNYDFLIVCLDAEETSIEERKATIIDFLKRENLQLKQGKLIIIVQNPCFETWFLGNRKIFKRNPQSTVLQRLIQFYNVQTNDPELMSSRNKEQTKAQFHHDYLKEIFTERNITYTKRIPELYVMPLSYKNSSREVRKPDTYYLSKSYWILPIT